MTYKLLAAAVLSLGMGTAALAQTDQSPGGAEPETNVQMPTGWEGDIAAAFFVDESTGELRTEDEAKANFAALSADQQAMVTEHCATVASTDATATDDNNMTTSSTSETSAQEPAAIAQVCEWASGM